MDEKIKSLVDILNSLDGIKTVGSCEGHKDKEEFENPYATFICTNLRNLGLLASIRVAYENPDELIDDFIKHQPNLNGYWSIGVLSGEDSYYSPEELKAEGRNPEEYVLFELSPHPLSYNDISKVHKDIKEIVKYYEFKIKEVYGSSK